MGQGVQLISVLQTNHSKKSIAKWLPQLYLNHILTSTAGFSLPVVILDLVGAITSFLELVVASVLAHDIPAIVGNPLKLGLSVIGVAMDGWFIGQRIVFGADRKDSKVDNDDDDDDDEAIQP